MKKCLFIFFMFNFLIGTCYSQVISTPDNFDINLPEGWGEIPKEVLDAYSGSFKEAFPEAPEQVYDYGFQLETSENWLEFPYILIQVNNIGRVPENELKKIKKVKNEMEKGAVKLEVQTSSVLSKAEVGETLYDEQNHILWSNLSYNVHESSKANALISLILTEKGNISVYCYSLEKELEEYKPVFEDFIKNITLKESLRYKPRLTDSLPLKGIFNWGSVVTNSLIGAAIGGSIALFVGLVKQRKGIRRRTKTP